MSDTFFTAPPHWQWLVILYFFFGGLAGGSYLIAVLADFFGDASDRVLARLGYYVAMPAVGIGGLLVFGGLAFLSFLGALAESGRAPAALSVLRHGPLARLIAVLGGLGAFFLAGYTGVLLAVTNRPV